MDRSVAVSLDMPERSLGGQLQAKGFNTRINGATCNMIQTDLPDKTFKLHIVKYVYMGEEQFKIIVDVRWNFKLGGGQEYAPLDLYDFYIHEVTVHGLHKETGKGFFQLKDHPSDRVHREFEDLLKEFLGPNKIRFYVKSDIKWKFVDKAPKMEPVDGTDLLLCSYPAMGGSKRNKKKRKYKYKSKNKKHKSKKTKRKRRSSRTRRRAR